jgi:hypothetical protein
MTERSRKPKAKPKRGDAGVLGTLPASRPDRIGRPRRAEAKSNHVAAVTPASPPLRQPDHPPPRPIGAPTGTELVTTTIRAAGELAQIGLTVGGQVLKRTLDRIPRP